MIANNMSVRLSRGAAILYVVALTVQTIAADVSNESKVSKDNVGSIRAVQGRQLWASGWSFSNLLFHVGLCVEPASTCPSYSSGPCGCPDCTKHPIPPHLHAYCDKLYYSGSTSSSSKSSGSNKKSGSSSSSTSTSTSSNSSNTTSTNTDTKTAQSYPQQNATRIYNSFWMYLAGGTATAMIAGAMMKNRDTEVDGTRAGLVSKRMALLMNGGDVEAMPGDLRAPDFIEVPSALHPPTVASSPHGIELMGPFHPSVHSSQYAI